VTAQHRPGRREGAGAEIDADVVEGEALRLVDRYRPGGNERDLAIGADHFGLDAVLQSQAIAGLRPFCLRETAWTIRVALPLPARGESPIISGTLTMREIDRDVL
jgi:hypothetical protein